MATDKQIAAKRINAQKSTGPRTPEGRAAVRLNGLKHGLTASTLVVPGESEADFEDLLDSIEAEHQPATPTEAALVRRIAMASWRLTRFYHMETGFFAIRHVDLRSKFEDYDGLDPGDRLEVIAHDDSNGSKTMMNLSLYGARLERSMHK